MEYKQLCGGFCKYIYIYIWNLTLIRFLQEEVCESVDSFWFWEQWLHLIPAHRPVII